MHKLRTILFVILAIGQLYICGRMIYDREAVLKNGREFRFEVRPIDPNDPFRGKYLVLSYKSDFIYVPSADFIANGEYVYAALEKDDRGFAVFSGLYQDPPAGRDYIHLQIDYTSNNRDSLDLVNFQLPFDRFYINEEDSYRAEEVMREALRSGSEETFAVVKVLNGEAVLEDLMIGDRSIREILSVE